MVSADRGRAPTIADVLSTMQSRLETMPAGREPQAEFLGTYRRTTQAVAAAVVTGSFEDPGWVEAWDVAFARLYLDALDADLTGVGRVPRPWRLAFNAPSTTSPLVHVLLGINAHITNDPPRALLAVISDDEFADPASSTDGLATTNASTGCSRRGSPRRTATSPSTRPAACSTGPCSRCTG